MRFCDPHFKLMYYFHRLIPTCADPPIKGRRWSICFPFEQPKSGLPSMGHPANRVPHTQVRMQSSTTSIQEACGVMNRVGPWSTANRDKVPCVCLAWCLFFPICRRNCQDSWLLCSFCRFIFVPSGLSVRASAIPCLRFFCGYFTDSCAQGLSPCRVPFWLAIVR